MRFPLLLPRAAHRFRNLGLAALVTAASALPAPAQLPPNFELVPLSGSFNTPAGMAFAPSGRLFLIEKRGLVRVHFAGVTQTTPFLDLRDEVNNWGSKGMLGVAVHPGFQPDGGASSWVYFLYAVSPVAGQDLSYNQNDQYSFSRLTRYKAQVLGSDVVADLGSRQVLLGNQLVDGTVPDGIALMYESHSNCSLRFADDGSLLVGAGDGAHFDVIDTGGFDPAGFETFVHPVTGLKGPMPIEQDSGSYRAQDLRSLAGKLLRIDPETGSGYPSNPFYDGDASSNPSRIWALGLRNPFRFVLQPGTGALDPALGQANRAFVGDVGEALWEELNIAVGGENFGWPCTEGLVPNPSLPAYVTHSHGANPLGLPDCLSPNPGVATDPALTWNHNDPTLVAPGGIYLDELGAPDPGGFSGSCAVAGAFYNGTNYPAEYVGRLFLVDYGQNWVKTIELDAQGDLLAVRDFSDAVSAIVAVEANPVTGDLYFLSLNDPSGQLKLLRFGTNLTPLAVVLADVVVGDAPLTVQFDGSTSSDPDLDPLTYEWDFDDGTPHSAQVSPSHSFVSDGAYFVTLTVTDPQGLQSTDTQLIVVGSPPPVVQITAPIQGFAYDGHVNIVPSALVFDDQDPNPSLFWQVDEYHNTHVHPQVASSTAESFSFRIDEHGVQGDLVYYRISLTVTNVGGLMTEDHVYVLPASYLRDLTGSSTPDSRLSELFPSMPLGTGNLDIEVVRDGVFPPLASNDHATQFDTFHVGDQGANDWISLEATQAPGAEQRYVAMTFQEGVHFSDGGWFETLGVEVRQDGVWTPVNRLTITPDYPFFLSGSAFFDGINCNTYELRFDPIPGDAIRLRGDPGGSSGYISVAELRAWVIAKDPVPLPSVRDVTDQGAVLAKLLELTPPVPSGGGNPDPSTISNGTTPPPGSASLWAQFDTRHAEDKGGEDWVGYSFPTSQQFARVVFQEGLHFATGGWFDTLGVEVRAAGSSTWVPVTGMSVTPSYPGSLALVDSYDTFRFDFDPVPARDIRIVGEPGGSSEFISVGELRVFSTSSGSYCGWESYGPGGLSGDLLTLGSWSIPRIGTLIEMEVVGSSGAGFGVVAFAASEVFIPLLDGTLLIHPVNVVSLPIFPIDVSGEGSMSFFLPNDPTLVGASPAFQGFALDFVLATTLLFSNGMEMVICPP